MYTHTHTHTHSHTSDNEDPAHFKEIAKNWQSGPHIIAQIVVAIIYYAVYIITSSIFMNIVKFLCTLLLFY